MADKDRIALAQMMQHSGDADHLSDGELIDAVIEHVWADLSIRSRESWLLGELLERFQKLANVDETPAGTTADGQPFWPDVVNEELNEPQ